MEVEVEMEVDGGVILFDFPITTLMVGMIARSRDSVERWRGMSKRDQPEGKEKEEEVEEDEEEEEEEEEELEFVEENPVVEEVSAVDAVRVAGMGLVTRCQRTSLVACVIDCNIAVTVTTPVGVSPTEGVKDAACVEKEEEEDDECPIDEAGTASVSSVTTAFASSTEDCICPCCSLLTTSLPSLALLFSSASLFSHSPNSKSSENTAPKLASSSETSSDMDKNASLSRNAAERSCCPHFSLSFPHFSLSFLQSLRAVASCADRDG